MELDEIQKMFSEIGLGSKEKRNKLVHDLSINMTDCSYDSNYEIKTSNNTLKTEQYA